jgi:hypothetical protein
MMHEHINYFTERSLTGLLDGSGCTVKAAGTYTLDKSTEEIVWCLGVVKERH